MRNPASKWKTSLLEERHEVDPWLLLAHICVYTLNNVHTHRKTCVCMCRPTHKPTQGKCWWRAGNAPCIGRKFRLVKAETDVTTVIPEVCQQFLDWESVVVKEQWNNTQLKKREGSLGPHPLLSVESPAAWWMQAEARGNRVWTLSIQCRLQDGSRTEGERVLKRQQKKSPMVIFELISFHMIKIIDKLALSEFCVYYKNRTGRLLCSLVLSKLG